MQKVIFLSALVLFFITGCGNQSNTTMKGVSNLSNSDTNQHQEVSCKLTSAALQQRKSTILERLRDQILEKKELRYPDMKKGDLKIYISDKPRNFIKVSEKFLGEKLNHVEVVRQK